MKTAVSKRAIPQNDSLTDFPLFTNLGTWILSKTRPQDNIEQLSVLTDVAITHEHDQIFKQKVSYAFINWLLERVRLDLNSVLDYHANNQADIPELEVMYGLKVITPANKAAVAKALLYCTNGDATDTMHWFWAYLNRGTWRDAQKVLQLTNTDAQAAIAWLFNTFARIKNG